MSTEPEWTTADCAKEWHCDETTARARLQDLESTYGRRVVVRRGNRMVTKKSALDSILDLKGCEPIQAQLDTMRERIAILEMVIEELRLRIAETAPGSGVFPMAKTERPGLSGRK